MLELHVDDHEDGDLLVCRPVGELDAYTVAKLRQRLARLAEARRVVFDLSDVRFVDSAGLGALIGGVRRVRDAGGDVAVCCARPSLARLLVTTGFDRVVTVAPDLGSALHALRPPEPA